MNQIDTSRLPASLLSEPPARLASYAMLFALGDALDWSQDGAGLEIAGLERPGEPERRTLPVAMLSPLSDLDDWRDALRVSGGMNRREPQGGHGGINVLIRPAPAASHPWILLDDLNPSRAAALCQQHAGLAVETSPSNAQAWLLLDACLRHIERTTITQALARRLGGDPGAANGSQYGRLAGFRQRKIERDGNWTNVIADTSRTRQPWLSAALLSLPTGGISGCEASPPCPTVVDMPSLSPAPVGPQAPTGGRPDGHEGDGSGDESAREFAFACHRLRSGWSPDRVVRAVAEHAIARGKRRAGAPAEKYAHATVRKAMQTVGARS